VSGIALPGETISANLNVTLKSLSLAAASGSKSPARLSGNLQVASGNVKNPNSFSGGGKVSVGPIPLPVVNLQNKVKVGQVLTAGTGTNHLVNLGMLSSSANLTGTQIPAINASIKFAGNNVTMSPFSRQRTFQCLRLGPDPQSKIDQRLGNGHLESGVTMAAFSRPSISFGGDGRKAGLSVHSLGPLR
jgi:hypothetical protein